MLTTADRRRVRDARRSRVLAFHRDGFTTGEIAAETGVTTACTYRDLAALGLRPNRRYRCDEVAEDYKWLTRSGETPESAAARIGLKLDSVQASQRRARSRADRLAPE